tara:strand:+ start:8450 stop:9979 length:1530 start_codon:yes stop_codon:yes gene_type:complete
MKITDIVQKIENPNLCTAEDVQDFEGLIKKYPYAQSFPILLLKTLGQAKDIHFEDSLNQHAYRISDRMHLYFLINDISEDLEEVSSSELQVASSEVKEEIEEVSSSKLQVVSSEVKEEIEEVSSSELQVASSEVEEEIEEVASSVDDDIIRLDYEKLLDQDIKFNKVEEMTFEPVRIHMDDDGEILTVKSDEEEIIESEELKVESSEVEEEIEKVPSSKLQVASSEVEEEIVESKELKVDEIVSFDIGEDEEIPSITIEEEIEAESADMEVSAIELQEANENKGAEIEIENIGIEFFDPTQEMEISNAVEDLGILKPSSFEEQHKTISLDFIEKKFNQEEDELTSNAISQGFQVTLESEKVASPVEKEVEKKTDVTESIAKFEQTSSDEKRSFYAWLHANEESTHPEKLDRSTEIIEKFIQEEPSISRSVKEDEQVEKKKTPFFKATEIAKESLKEKRIPVSVTLAQIFESQGNFPKAIHSYEQLMLLYPEKKTFFANQIKKLKKKLNN